MNPQDKSLNRTDNEKAQEVERRLGQTKIQKHAEDLKWVMGDSRGRRVIAAYLDEFRLLRDCFDTNGQVTANNLGMQKAARWIYQDIVECVGFPSFVKMMDEVIQDQIQFQKDLNLELAKLKKRE